jgi:hypothetical protein
VQLDPHPGELAPDRVAAREVLRGAGGGALGEELLDPLDVDAAPPDEPVPAGAQVAPGRVEQDPERGARSTAGDRG